MNILRTCSLARAKIQFGQEKEKDIKYKKKTKIKKDLKCLEALHQKCSSNCPVDSLRIDLVFGRSFS
jgi:Fe-S-cluster-containing hydrogenase component 2